MNSRKKRAARLALLSALIAVCLLLASCEALGIVSLPWEETAQSASEHKTSEPDGKIAVTNVTPGTILDYFSEVAIGSEYGESVDVVCKWTKPIKYYVKGDATESDLALLGRLCDRLNGIEGFPGISETSFESTANMTVSFISQDELIASFDSADETCGGMASYEWDSATGKIISARCAIDRELNADRDCTICEEFLQSLGPAMDSYMFPNSVFYQGYTLTPFPIDLDFAVMEILYSPSLPAGTPKLEAMSIAATLVKWEK